VVARGCCGALMRASDEAREVAPRGFSLGNTRNSECVTCARCPTEQQLRNLPFVRSISPVGGLILVY